MNTKAFFVLSTVLSLLLLFANRIDARKDLGEIWRKGIKNKDMPESNEARCKEDSEHKHVAKNFELMPDLSIYDNGIKPTGRQRSFVRNFELMPDILMYDNGFKPTKQKAFAKKFELMPDAPIYDRGVKPIDQIFEHMPDVSIYEPTKQKSMESKPDTTIYRN